MAETKIFQPFGVKNTEICSCGSLAGKILHKKIFENLIPECDITALTGSSSIQLST